MSSSTTKQDLAARPVSHDPHAERQQLAVVVQNARDRRVLEWLIAQVGEEAVAAACKQLAGNRRPYVSNLAKVLNLNPPDDLSLTPREEVARRIASLKQLLRRNE